MISEILKKRYPNIQLEKIPHAFFIQMCNLYMNDLNNSLLDKIDGYKYTDYGDEHFRILAQSMNKFCNEDGIRTLKKPEYKKLSFQSEDYNTFENFMFDDSASKLDKLSLIELLFRETGEHFQKEIIFLQENIPKYKNESEKIEQQSQKDNTNYYNNFQEKLEKAKEQLDQKRKGLNLVRNEIEKRLKEHKVPFAYHNGYFYSSEDSLIEEQISQPFWDAISNPKYINVEKDMRKAIDYYDSNKGDAASSAAKALESMVKIICYDKGLEKKQDLNILRYIELLNAKENGSIILNEEKEELIKFFQIRNGESHGAGKVVKPELTKDQTQRFIYATMVWILSLTKR